MNSLLKYNLDKQSLNEFFDHSGRIKTEFKKIIDVVLLTKFFSAIIRNHKTDALDMTL
jgi:hypothetical protein